MIDFLCVTNNNGTVFEYILSCLNQGLWLTCHSYALLMKQLFALLGAVMLLTGCNKAIEKIAEDMVIKAMTDGQWKVTTFTQNGTDITADFTGYKFQYHKNKTVDAYKDGSIERTGTWDTDSGWTYVKATQTNGTEVKTMRLDKL
jgi:hypothetical protein